MGASSSKKKMVRPPNPYNFLPKVPTFKLTSPDFEEGGSLKPEHRSKAFDVEGGQDKSPAFSWSGAPAETKSYVLTCYDPDAPTVSGFWHWVVYDIPPSCTSLASGAGNPDGSGLPPGAKMLKNDAGFAGFVGAAPPPGHGDHRYIFCVSALPVETLPIDENTTPTLSQFQMFGAGVLARGFTTGIFGR